MCMCVCIHIYIYIYIHIKGILREVQSESSVPDKTILLLGRQGIGKRTLVQAEHLPCTEGYARSPY